MKCAQKRSENISSDVKTNRILPCAGVRMLPVMFWIQPSVPSSTAPTSSVRHEQDEQQQRSDREVGLDADDQQQRERDAPRQSMPHAPTRRTCCR